MVSMILLNFRSNYSVSNQINIHFHMQEWQARQRERTKEWHAYRQKEEAEEERITNEYREIGMRLKAYPQEEVRKARILVSSFIRAGEDVEEVTSNCPKDAINSFNFRSHVSLPYLYDTTFSHSLVDYGK